MTGSEMPEASPVGVQIVAVEADPPVRLELNELGEQNLLREVPVEELDIQRVDHVPDLECLVAMQP